MVTRVDKLITVWFNNKVLMAFSLALKQSHGRNPPSQTVMVV